MVGSGIGRGSCCGDDGVHDSQGDGLFLSEESIFKPIGLELPCEALVEPGVCLRVSRFLGSGRPSRRCAVAIAPHA